MSVFLTPELKPFFAGTYFPPADMYGRPGFKNLLAELAKVYNEDRGRIDKIANDVTVRLSQHFGRKYETVGLNKTIVTIAENALLKSIDPVHGGFGGAPKFPHAIDISFLFKRGIAENNQALLNAALFSLQKMARGGIYDQIGGGFHRYSVDEKWLVPHFEKML